MRYLARLLLAAMIFGTAQSARAEDLQGPLAPGKAAGIQKAQSDTQLRTIGILAGAGLAIIGAYLIVGTDYPTKKVGTGGNPSASGTH